MDRKYAGAVAIVLALSLAACGSRQRLTPPEGQTLPVASYGSDQPPNPDDLLEPSTQAKPERNVELLTKSSRRVDDPFDLPPE